MEFPPEAFSICSRCGRRYERQPRGCSAERHLTAYNRILKFQRNASNEDRKQTLKMRLKVPRIKKAPPTVSDEPGFYYLASPFWHDSPDVRLKRYLAAKDVAVTMTRRGYPVVSGIQFVVDGYHIDLFDLSFAQSSSWAEVSHRLLKSCSRGLILLKSIGEVLWLNSPGCCREFVIAYDANMPIYLLDPTSYKLTLFTPIDRAEVIRQLRPHRR